MTFPIFVSGDVLNASDMNAVGQWVTKTQTTFTTASSIIADNVFTTDYESYLIQVRYITSSTTGIAFQLRVGGVTAATNYNRQLLTVTSTTVTGQSVTSQTSVTGLLNSTNGTFYSSSTIIVNGPALAQATSGWGMNARSNGAYTTPSIEIATFNHSTGTAYDGFELTVGTGTATGNYTVYGLRK